jgi:hypothetical protein
MIWMDLPLRESKSVFTNVGIAPHRLQTIADAVFTSADALNSKSISTSALLQEKR